MAATPVASPPAVAGEASSIFDATPPASVDTPAAAFAAVARRDAALARCTVAPQTMGAGPVVDARSFGAVPDDGIDDAAALQRALDQAPEGARIVLPPGELLQNRRLTIRRAGIVLAGNGTILRATNPDDQAILIQADHVAVVGLVLHANTTTRLGAPWQSRIAVLGVGEPAAIVRGTVIAGNRILPDARGGAAYANSASAAGIELHRAEGFIVADNVVARTLSDGIHVTEASRHGAIIGNRVAQTGDDTIGLVSYLGTVPDGLAEAEVGGWLQRGIDATRNDDLVVAGNLLSAPYWGRGISVVGGSRITLRGNRLDNLPLAAAVYVARELDYFSHGVEDVIVEANVIDAVQTRAPPYDVGGKFASAVRTGHGAIEIYGWLSARENASPTLRDRLGVTRLFVNGNRITETATAPVRIGVGSGITMAGGVTGGPISDVTIAATLGTQQRSAVVVDSRVSPSQLESCPGAQLAIRAPDGAACRPRTGGAALRCTDAGG